MYAIYIQYIIMIHSILCVCIVYTIYSYVFHTFFSSYAIKRIIWMQCIEQKSVICKAKTSITHLCF